MKLLLTVGGLSQDGYVHVDPVPGSEDTPAFQGNFNNLTAVCDFGECREILATDIMDYVRADDVFSTLEHLSKLLAHGGKLIIGGTDLYELAKAIMNQTIDLREANVILYGNVVRKMGQLSLDHLTELLLSFGLKIHHKRVNGLNMVVEAVRP